MDVHLNVRRLERKKKKQGSKRKRWVMFRSWKFRREGLWNRSIPKFSLASKLTWLKPPFFNNGKGWFERMESGLETVDSEATKAGLTTRSTIRILELDDIDFATWLRMVAETSSFHCDIKGWRKRRVRSFRSALEKLNTRDDNSHHAKLVEANRCRLLSLAELLRSHVPWS